VIELRFVRSATVERRRLAQLDLRVSRLQVDDTLQRSFACVVAVTGALRVVSILILANSSVARVSLSDLGTHRTFRELLPLLAVSLEPAVLVIHTRMCTCLYLGKTLLLI
jgi:hypothetical protein